VLTRLERAARPVGVQAVDQGHVHRLNLLVVEQRLIGLVNAGDRVRRRQLTSARRLARGDGNQVTVAGGGDRRRDRAPGDPGSPEDAPAEAVGYAGTSTGCPEAIDCAAASITATLRRASSGRIASGSPSSR
jgi:hypothetical protein